MNINDQNLGDLKTHWKNQIHALDQSAIVAITDTKGEITYVNAMFCDLSEYSSEELIGKTHAVINSGYHEPSFFKEMWGTIGRGEIWRGEVKNKSKNGNFYWVDTTIVPIENHLGQLEQYIAIRYDITSRKKAEESLAEERVKLVESEKMASIGVLSAGIAHELGNPLGAIRGRLEMLEAMIAQEGFEKDLAISSVQKMIENVDRMSKIIRGLKNSSRDGSKDEMQNFNITQLVGDILELSQQRCEKNGVKLEADGINESIVIKGRETEIGQVIVNLLNNAFDAVKTQRDSWIKVSIEKIDNDLYLKVKDSGEGVSEGHLQRIFDPFFTTKDVGQGTGLGLSICRSFAEGHGGQLFYDKTDKHSCFVLKLPQD